MEHKTEITIVRQCELLELCRSTVYYQSKPLSPADLRLMRRIDQLHLAHPFLGARKLAGLLQGEDFQVGRRHVGSLMRRMGLEAIYRKKRTSLPSKGHRTFPYLLGGLSIERPNQVWAADITYIPMRKGFVYLFAVMDWSSRRVLAWRLSNTLTTDFCLDAVREALYRYGRPEIFNTDQGCQFTSVEFTDLLKDNGIQISMDGKGCWRDNIFVERLWKSIKYEEVYLRAYDTVADAKAKLATYLRFYNERRPHRAHDGRTPDQMYFGALGDATPLAA